MRRKPIVMVLLVLLAIILIFSVLKCSQEKSTKADVEGIVSEEGIGSTKDAAATKEDDFAQIVDDETSLERGKILALSCGACHGTHGRGASTIPALQGFEKGYLLEALKSFQDGSRDSTVMQRIARGYSNAELSALAHYFANQE